MTEPEMSERTQRSPNARLQDEILLYMYRHEVDTVSGLARELGATRSSVSRAMHALASGGFVSRDGEGWTLTKVGEEEARLIREQRSEQPERYEMRPVLEALNSFTDSAKDLERISEQIQLLARFAEEEPQSPREEVYQLRLIFDRLREMMEPLEELADRMGPLLNKFESSEEELPELDARDMHLLMEMARAYERAQWLYERVSEGMKALTSLIDKLQLGQEGKASADASRPKDTLTPGAG